MFCKFRRCTTFNYATTSSSRSCAILQSTSCKLLNNSNYRTFTLSMINRQASSSDNSSNSSSPASTTTQNNSSNSPSSTSTSETKNYTFSLEDLERVKQELIQNLIDESSSSRVPLPSPGKSSGNQSIDEATKQWRLTNTKDDENLQKLFKATKQKQKATTSLLEQSQLNGTNPYIDDDFEVGVDEEEFSKYVNPFNPETQEVNGPKGAEPTRFGDWERSGRCFDF